MVVWLAVGFTKVTRRGVIGARYPHAKKAAAAMSLSVSGALASLARNDIQTQMIIGLFLHETRRARNKRDTAQGNVENMYWVHVVRIALCAEAIESLSLA